MSKIAVVALRVVIGATLAGTLVVQIVMAPLLWNDLAGVPDALRALVIVILVAGIVTLQVCAVCVWILLSMVGRGTVFSHAAFRYVDVIIGAIATAAVLVFTLAVLLAPGDTAPGVVGLVCGASLVVGGVALIVFVLRVLLKQAVEREIEASHLRSELSEVI